MLNNESLLQEVSDRCRRMETRLTRFIIESGFEANTQMPEWHKDGTIQVPSPSVSVKDLLSVIPVEWPNDEEISVMIRAELLFSLYKGNYEVSAVTH